MTRRCPGCGPPEPPPGRLPWPSRPTPEAISRLKGAVGRVIPGLVLHIDASM